MEETLMIWRSKSGLAGEDEFELSVPLRARDWEERTMTWLMGSWMSNVPT